VPDDPLGAHVRVLHRLPAEEQQCCEAAPQALGVRER
jgi:hypothetical protein